MSFCRAHLLVRRPSGIGPLTPAKNRRQTVVFTQKLRKSRKNPCASLYHVLRFEHLSGISTLGLPTGRGSSSAMSRSIPRPDGQGLMTPQMRIPAAVEAVEFHKDIDIAAGVGAPGDRSSSVV